MGVSDVFGALINESGHVEMCSSSARPASPRWNSRRREISGGRVGGG